MDLNGAGEGFEDETAERQTHSDCAAGRDCGVAGGVRSALAARVPCGSDLYLRLSAGHHGHHQGCHDRTRIAADSFGKAQIGRRGSQPVQPRAQVSRSSFQGSGGAERRHPVQHSLAGPQRRSTGPAHAGHAWPLGSDGGPGRMDQRLCLARHTSIWRGSARLPDHGARLAGNGAERHGACGIAHAYRMDHRAHLHPGRGGFSCCPSRSGPVPAGTVSARRSPGANQWPGPVHFGSRGCLNAACQAACAHGCEDLLHPSDDFAGGQPAHQRRRRDVAQHARLRLDRQFLLALGRAGPASASHATGRTGDFSRSAGGIRTRHPR